ncbi:MAG: hypothetical protein ACI9CU_002498 [Polaribacter sp.]|jgi:hypothetical protein
MIIKTTLITTAVCCLIAITSFGQVNNFTTLTIESGATLYVDNSVNNSAGATISNAGEVRISGDFDNSGTSSIGSLVTLNGANAQSVTGTSRFYGVLQVDKSGGAATVTSGTTSVHGILRLTEGSMNANSNLVIASTPTETGLVDDFSDISYDGSLTGNLRVQRYIFSGVGGFHYIGSAVNTASLTELSELNLYGPDGGQIVPQPDCHPDNIDATSPYGNLFEWSEAGPFLVPGCLQSGWFVRSTGVMTNGRGYAGIIGSGTLEIGGSVGNTSELSTVTYSGLSNTTVEGDGWHIVSNPFPSPMQWYTPPAGFDSQISIWQPSGSYNGTYQPVLAHPTNPLALIGSSQGFFARASTGPSSFSLPQAYRRLGDPVFYKEDLQNTFDIIVEAGGFADKTRVRFGNTGETNSFDSMHDANKLMARGAQPTLMTRLRGVEYGINSLSLEDHPMTVPMDLYPGISGEFKFHAEHLDLFTVEAHVYLEDLKLDKIQELTINPVYVFKADESDDPDRFLLHFRLDHEEPLYTGDNVLMYTNNNSAYLFLPELNGKAQLHVYSALGKLVFQTANLMEGKNEFDLSHLATGAYVLRATVNDTPISRKVIL